VAAKFHKLTNNTPFRYVEALIDNFKTTQDKDVFRDAIIDVSRLQKSSHLYEAQILELVGVSPEFSQAKSISKDISDLIRWLEEILCLAMVDAEELWKAHKSCSLMYQT
jgi:hypothetical protein